MASLNPWQTHRTHWTLRCALRSRIDRCDAHVLAELPSDTTRKSNRHEVFTKTPLCYRWSMSVASFVALGSDRARYSRSARTIQ